MKLVSRRRFEPSHDLGNPLRLAPDHPALTEKRSLFPSRVRDPGPDGWVLKSGANVYKLGSMVTKGKKGPLFSLSLEERSTCPHDSKGHTGCKLWAECYMNRSPFSIRYRHGRELVRQLSMEVKILALRNEFFHIRLHQSGDFYSPGYVRQWGRWLDQFQGLNIFGYTHHRPGTPIGNELAKLINTRWDRFAVRWSNSNRKTKSTRTLMEVPQSTHVDGALVCPAQLLHTTRPEKQITCGSCMACVNFAGPIAFVIH